MKKVFQTEIFKVNFKVADGDELKKGSSDWANMGGGGGWGF